MLKNAFRGGTGQQAPGKISNQQPNRLVFLEDNRCQALAVPRESNLNVPSGRKWKLLLRALSVDPDESPLDRLF